MYVIEQNIAEKRTIMVTGVFPPPDKHLKRLGPVTAIPFRVFFCLLLLPAPVNPWCSPVIAAKQDLSQLYADPMELYYCRNSIAYPESP